MPPRHTYWTIILEGKPTAFRAHTQEELQPTLRQLQSKHPDTVLMWFARGRLWKSEEESRAAYSKSRPPGDRRGPAWRPGGSHEDPRARFKIPRDEKRRRFRERLFRDQVPEDRELPVREGEPERKDGPPPRAYPPRPDAPRGKPEARPWSKDGRPTSEADRPARPDRPAHQRSGQGPGSSHRKPGWKPGRPAGPSGGDRGSKPSRPSGQGGGGDRGWKPSRPQGQSSGGRDRGWKPDRPTGPSGGGDRGWKPSRPRVRAAVAGSADRNQVDPRDQVAAATAAGNQVDLRVKGAVAIVWKPGRPPGKAGGDNRGWKPNRPPGRPTGQGGRGGRPPGRGGRKGGGGGSSR